MPSGLKRLQKAESLHFITFSCLHRFPLLEAAGARETVEAVLEQTRARHPARIYAYVLMPEHVHLKCMSALLVHKPRALLWTVRHSDANLSHLILNHVRDSPCFPVFLLDLLQRGLCFYPQINVSGSLFRYRALEPNTSQFQPTPQVQQKNQTPLQHPWKVLQKHLKPKTAGPIHRLWASRLSESQVQHSYRSRSPSPFVPGELHVNKTVRKVNSGFEVLPAGTFGTPTEFKDTSQDEDSGVEEAIENPEEATEFDDRTTAIGYRGFPVLTFTILIRNRIRNLVA